MEAAEIQPMMEATGGELIEIPRGLQKTAAQYEKHERPRLRRLAGLSAHARPHRSELPNWSPSASPKAYRKNHHARRRQATRGTSIPFDTERLDRLMDEAGIDVLFATSKHNVQYLLGGHRAFFFDNMDAMGLSRYLPVWSIPRARPQGRPISATGWRTSRSENEPFWVRRRRPTRPARSTSWRRPSTTCAAGVKTKRSAPSSRSCRSMRATRCARRSPEARSRMRYSCSSGCVRSRRPDELEKLRIASERVIDSMLAVIANHGPGATKAS